MNVHLYYIPILSQNAQIPCSYASTYATYDYDHAQPIHAIHFFSSPTTSQYESKRRKELDATNAMKQGRGLEKNTLKSSKERVPEVMVGTWRPISQTVANTIATRHRDQIQQPNNSSTRIYNMADNKKQEKDYTKEVDALLPEAEAIVKVL